MAEMDTFEGFREELRDALICLHDPDYQPSRLLPAVIGCAPQDGAGPVQSALIDVLERLRSAPGTAGGARASRMYDTLYLRFVQRLTQEETAERLHISVRHLRRVQREATHMLARLLWEHSLAREASAEEMHIEGGAPYSGRTATGTTALDWRTQVAQDLASLQKSMPGAVADVGRTIRGVVDLERALTERHGVNLSVGPVEPGLVVPVHPSALRQALIMAIGQLVRDAPSGSISVSAARAGGDVRITLAGPLVPGSPSPNGGPIRELLASFGGSVEVSLEESQVVLRVDLPSAGEIRVLVVDDNPQMAHFYQRCTMGTRYRILHAAQGRRVFEEVEVTRPDIIVLDIMLPDVDGWELLTQLHEHPTTRSTPVIVCSVIREEELALALGAVRYILKPVQPWEFIQALDQALASASTASPEAGASRRSTG